MHARHIRVAVLEPHPLLREGVAALIGDTDGLECVGAWPDAQHTLGAVRETAPDVLLLDLPLPTPPAPGLPRVLPFASPGTRVIALVDCAEEGCPVLSRDGFPACRTPPAPFRDCRQIVQNLGVQAVLPKRSSFRRIEQMIRTICTGEGGMEERRYLPPEDGGGHLTARERQIVALVAQGLSNKEIAGELKIAYSTVKNYVSSILEKLDLHDRTQIVLYALANRL